MTYLIDSFCRSSLKNLTVPVTKIYNAFIETLSDEREVEFIKNNMVLFLKAATAARNAIPEMQKKITL